MKNYDNIKISLDKALDKSAITGSEYKLAMESLDRIQVCLIKCEVKLKELLKGEPK